MIKTGDLVGWFDGGLDGPPTPNELDDFGVVVSIYSVEQDFGFPKGSKIKIAWVKDPDEVIDEYSFSWAKSELEKGALFVLNQP